MKEVREIAKKELALLGFVISNDQIHIVADDGSERVSDIRSTVAMLSSEIKENKNLLAELLIQIRECLAAHTVEEPVKDSDLIKIFIASIQNIGKFIDMFEQLDGSSVKKAVREALRKDCLSFSNQQMNKICDLQISLHWVHRLICRLRYARKLLLFYTKGDEGVTGKELKLARSVSGPWANLDLPMRERAWDWSEEEPNLRDRREDIRRQRRYKKGLENYNNDGRVGEGHYWREIANEPYSFWDRDHDSPYKTRTMLSRWG